MIVINSERAAIEWAPEFRGKMIRTRKQILEDMAQDFIAREKSGKKKGTSSLSNTQDFDTKDEKD